MKKIVQVNIKRKQTFGKNVMFMSAKTVLSDIIPIVN